MCMQLAERSFLPDITVLTMAAIPDYSLQDVQQQVVSGRVMPTMISLSTIWIYLRSDWPTEKRDQCVPVQVIVGSSNLSLIGRIHLHQGSI